MKRIDVSALEIYRNRIFKILILFIPIVALLAGVTFTALKLAGQYPTVSMSALFAFDFSCLLYFCVGLGFVRYCEDAQGNLSPKAVLAGKIFLFLVEGIQWNFITYMIPSRDFWGYAVFFVLLTVFFLDHRFVAFVEAEIGVSLLLSWWLRPEELLPVHDAYFVPEIVLRLVLLFLSFFCLWSLTRTIQKSLVAELENIADFDTLTMLYNRRRLSIDLEKTVEDILKNEAPYSVLMCDIDDFKAVNDTYGHACGDEILKNTAAVLKRALKYTGAAYRYGGEEILVLLKLGKEEAVAKAEEVRAAVEASPVTFNGQSVGAKLTIGVAVFDSHAPNPDATVRCADAGLYYGKNHGKNQVVI